MGSNFQIKWILGTFLTVFFQVIFLRDLALGNLAFCFIYLWIIVKAPIQIPIFYCLIGAFSLGWLVDIFYNTHGIHAFATVLIAFLRPVFFKLLTPANGYDDRSTVSLSEMKWLWFFPYVFLMLFTHHVILFFLEASDVSLVGLSLIKALLSTLLGMLVFGILELFHQEN